STPAAASSSSSSRTSSDPTLAASIMSDITTLDDDACQAVWQRLQGALLSGAHPEDGDPVTPGVAWAVYEEHDVFGPDFHRRLLAAVGEGGQITALEYYDDGDGGVTVAGG